MTDVQIIAEALADVMPPLEPSEYWAEAVVAALVDAGRVIVDRDDLELALRPFEDEKVQCAQGFRETLDRLRSVLTEGGPDA